MSEQNLEKMAGYFTVGPRFQAGVHF